jgi:ABC-type transport system involved in multi-copper enzyme maturation permease subunit
MSGSRASRWHVLLELARADFLERVRRYSFLITLLFAMYFGYLAATGKILLQVGHMRGIYNSAWIGTLMSLVATTFLSLAGFYVVKNTIERDRATRVGEILASTPISKILYLSGKWLSNFMVLAVMVGILGISGIAMQFFQGEDSHLQLWKLLAPFLLLALPAMALVAAVAVVFETITWLRGGFGNVAYFFVWTAGLAVPASAGAEGGTSPYDWAGLNLVWNSMRAAAPTSNNSFSFSVDVGTLNFVHATFLWNGIAWTGGMVLWRIAWIGFALALVAFSALLFDRFDPARRRLLSGRSKPASSDLPEISGVAEGSSVMGAMSAVTLTPLRAGPVHFRFGAMLVAELRLMLKGQKWWWYAGAVLLVALAAALPGAQARGVALCVAWIWPVLMWSTMGVRESRDRTSPLLFSAPHPIASQLPAVWCAGVVLGLITGSGFALRLLLGGNWRGLLAWLIGAAFIPTFALALGVWSGTSKPFEILYTLLWYLGPMHATVPLDFMGSAPATALTRVPLFYLALAAGMSLAALAGRKRQLQT